MLRSGHTTVRSRLAYVWSVSPTVEFCAVRVIIFQQDLIRIRFLLAAQSVLKLQLLRLLPPLKMMTFVCQINSHPSSYLSSRLSRSKNNIIKSCNRDLSISTLYKPYMCNVIPMGTVSAISTSICMYTSQHVDLCAVIFCAQCSRWTFDTSVLNILQKKYGIRSRVRFATSHDVCGCSQRKESRLQVVSTTTLLLKYSQDCWRHTQS